MKCPILHHKKRDPDVFPGEEFEDCLEAECAWWDIIYSRCIVLSAGKYLGGLCKALGSIARRSPPAPSAR